MPLVNLYKWPNSGNGDALNKFNRVFVYPAQQPDMLAPMTTPRPTSRKPRLAAAWLLCAGLVAQLSVATAADYHVLPAARGDGNGGSWEHAAAAPTGSWSAVLAKLEPGDTLRVGSGEYRDAALPITRGGAKDAPLTITGEDTGDGLPVFASGWVKERPGEGEPLITIAPGAGHVAIRDLRVRNHLAAVITEGSNDTVAISGLDVRDVRAGVIFKHNAVAEKPETWTRNVLVQDCTFVGFTRSALRWEGGNRDFRIVNVHGDAGGKPYATDPFHMVFNLRGDQRKNLPEGVAMAHDRDITFSGCVARNAYHEAPPGKKYWNADGYVVERGVANLTFIDCMAFDCTDGGWDLKATNVTFKGCVAFRNKRNFRMWTDATYENCIAGYPIKRGGSGGTANFGVYANAVIRLDRCTAIGDTTTFSMELGAASKDAPHERVFVKNSLIVSIDQPPEPANSRVKLENTASFPLKDAPAGPVFTETPSADWDGLGAALDATPAYAGKGFRRAPSR